MKKSLIALAALAAVGVASAQSSVTMRGNIDVGFGSASANTVKQTSAYSGLFSTSRLIIEGTEDLGGGLKARFYTETGLAATTHLATGVNNTTASATNYINSERTSTAIGDRGIFLGLMGAFGEINIGRVPHTTGAPGLGMGGGTQNAFFNAVFAGAAHPGQNGDVNLSSQAEGRANNSFLYIAPRFSGIQVRVQHSLGGGQGDSSQGNRTSYALNYTQGPLALEAMSSTRKAFSAGDNTATGNTPNQTSSYSAYAEGPKRQETGFGARYDMGVAVLGAGYAKQKSTDAAGAVTSFDASGISVTVPMGALSLTGGFAKHNPASNAADYSSYSVIAQYAFSKRTQAYASFRANNQPSSSSTSAKDSLTLFGVNHVF
jgi:predicted porin